MIVRKHLKGWHIYFHRAHALLAMKVGMAIDQDLWPLPAYWPEGLAGILEHDDGQDEWKEKNHLNEAGAPFDYREQRSTDLTQVERAVNDAKYKSSFIALMVSIHGYELHKELTDKGVKNYLKRQANLQEEILKNLQLKKKEVEQSYEFLRWCDELSLILCQDDILTNQRKIQVGTLGKHGMITMHRNQNGELILEPWCFAKKELSMTVEGYVTEKLSYMNDNELKKELDNSYPIETLFYFKCPVK